MGNFKIVLNANNTACCDATIKNQDRVIFYNPQQGKRFNLRVRTAAEIKAKRVSAYQYLVP